MSNRLGSYKLRPTLEHELPEFFSRRCDTYVPERPLHGLQKIVRNHVRPGVCNWQGWQRVECVHVNWRGPSTQAQWLAAAWVTTTPTSLVQSWGASLCNIMYARGRQGGDNAKNECSNLI